MKAPRVLPLAEPDTIRGIDETAQRREGDHQIAHHAYGGTEPIAPGGEEAHQIAEAGPGIAVDAAVELGSESRQIEELAASASMPTPVTPPADQHGAGPATSAMFWGRLKMPAPP